MSPRRLCGVSFSKTSRRRSRTRQRWSLSKSSIDGTPRDSRARSSRVISVSLAGWTTAIRYGNQGIGSRSGCSRRRRRERLQGNARGQETVHPRHGVKQWSAHHAADFDTKVATGVRGSSLVVSEQRRLSCLEDANGWLAKPMSLLRIISPASKGYDRSLCACGMPCRIGKHSVLSDRRSDSKLLGPSVNSAFCQRDPALAMAGDTCATRKDQ